jgi:hypothetical protein
MQEHQEHSGHSDHWHDSACGHEAVQRSGGHVDYAHDGHEHHEHDGHWDEHSQGGEMAPSQNPSKSTAF